MGKRYARRIQEQNRSVRPLLKLRGHSLNDAERERVASSLAELPPLLAAAYRAKEDFYGMYDRCSNAKEAALYYRSWRMSLGPELEEPFIRHCVPHETMLGAVFNFFDHPLTNAYLESTNRRIADLQRHGSGHDFEALRGPGAAGA
jgi:transposase